MTQETANWFSLWRIFTSWNYLKRFVMIPDEYLPALTRWGHAALVSRNLNRWFLFDLCPLCMIFACGDTGTTSSRQGCWQAHREATSTTQYRHQHLLPGPSHCLVYYACWCRNRWSSENPLELVQASWTDQRPFKKTNNEYLFDVAW